MGGPGTETDISRPRSRRKPKALEAEPWRGGRRSGAPVHGPSALLPERPPLCPSISAPELLGTCLPSGKDRGPRNGPAPRPRQSQDGAQAGGLCSRGDAGATVPSTRPERLRHRDADGGSPVTEPEPPSRDFPAAIKTDLPVDQVTANEPHISMHSTVCLFSAVREVGGRGVDPPEAHSLVAGPKGRQAEPLCVISKVQDVLARPLWAPPGPGFPSRQVSGQELQGSRRGSQL